MENNREKIIFFGNGPLAEYALAVIERECQVIFHAHRKEDLAEAVRLKQEFPEAHGVLASFGVMIPGSVLEAFEPEGILNVHPSLLPLYRGASPIESAILDGDSDFSVSVMKLVKAMDAGPVYYQETLTGAEISAKTGSELV
jgi:methionyl-tRNA formyltransferase